MEKISPVVTPVTAILQRKRQRVPQRELQLPDDAVLWVLVPRWWLLV